ncbi:uncharacterized protein LOC119886723 [Micropterus salmoides]|uniref:uncharacterized protein LOC119886723 n=1 Tax=Micropterus salmoides TaxID=27706 RepID=UPI0018EBE763|nr:uncharacterized protein LOC119886723 [Micropterus salmoides]
MKQWCVVRFSSGGTEIVPHTWIKGETVLWPPYPPKESAKVRAAVKRRDEPTEGWHTYEPVRLLISRDTFKEAQRSMHRYLQELCDTTDIQSEEEAQCNLKRKTRPNPIYNNSDSEDNIEQPKKTKYPQAPKVLFLASTTLQSAPHPSTSLQPINDPAHAPTSWQLPPQLESYTSAHLSPFPHDDFQNDLPPRSYASLQPSQQLQECVGFPALHSIPFRDYLQKIPRILQGNY